MTIAKTFGIGFLASLCLVGLVSVASAQSGDAEEGPDPGRQCTVSVNRSQDAGVFDVARREFSNGNCVCHISTGPAGQGAAIESRIAALVESRRCPAARVVQIADGSTDVVSSGTGKAVVAALDAGILAATIATVVDGDDEPVSP